MWQPALVSGSVLQGKRQRQPQQRASRRQAGWTSSPRALVLFSTPPPLSRMFARQIQRLVLHQTSLSLPHRHASTPHRARPLLPQRYHCPTAQSTMTIACATSPPPPSEPASSATPPPARPRMQRQPGMDMSTPLVNTTWTVTSAPPAQPQATAERKRQIRVAVKTNVAAQHPPASSLCARLPHPRLLRLLRKRALPRPSPSTTTWPPIYGLPWRG